MDIIVVIPARYGSTRFEGKPLFPILGKPMIQWVYERSAKADGVTRVVVATDDERIREAVEAFGGQVVMTGDRNRSGTDRVGEAAEKMGLRENDIVVNVQGDQPLIDPRCLEAVIEPLRTNSGIGMSTLAFRIVRVEEISNPKDVKVVFDQKGNALYFSRSPIPLGRDPETVYDSFKHLGVYAYTRKFLDIFRSLPDGNLEQIEKLEQLRAMEYGHPVRVVVTEYDSPEVDHPEDIARIEALLKD